MTDRMELTSLDWALELYDHGYQVILVPHKGKRPAIAWRQYQTERVPRALVEEWYGQGSHNIAVLTGAISGIVVVDGDSHAACEFIEAQCDPTPMKVLTSKGAHFYFKHPGGKVQNAVRVVDDPPVDLRADGGLVIGPGSIHPSGTKYRMAPGSDLASVHDLPLFRREWFSMDTTRVIEFRRPTIHFDTPQAKTRHDQAQKYILRVPGAVEGNGGDVHTYIQACRLVRGFDLTDDEALDLLRSWNVRCTPPWDDAELAAKVKHARSYGTGEFGSMLVKNQGGVLIYGMPA